MTSPFFIGRDNMIQLLLLLVLSEPSLFAPTPLDNVREALKITSIAKDDVVYDLGCGDGRVVLMAAKIYGCKAVGIDLDRKCVELAKRNVNRNNLQDKVLIKYGDILKEDLGKATVIYVYLMPELTEQLIHKFKNVKVIAYDKPLPGIPPQKKITLVGDYPHFVFFYSFGP